MKKGKRAISKAKMYGFNPYVDQLDSINKIMAEGQEKSEAAILRTLIDEALAARRPEASPLVVSPSTGQRIDDTLQTIQSLLLKLVRQGETSLRIQDLNLALTQDTLAESRAARMTSWNMAAPGIRKVVPTDAERATQFDNETQEAKDYAYSIAEEIRKSQ